MPVLDFNPEITNVYKRTFESQGKIVVNRGGTRSSKTYSMAQLAVRWLLTGRIRKHEVIPKGIFSIVRKTFPSLKASAMRDVIEVLENHGLYKYVHHNRTDHLITFPGTGRVLEFFAADDQQKVRSRGRDILYCCEANELEYLTTFYQMLMRTKGPTFIDLNPDDPYNWINEEIEINRQKKRGDVSVIVSTYKDNPYLNADHVAEIEYMKEVDEELWLVYGLGEYGKVTGLVFPNVTIVDRMPEGLDRNGLGLDFGFTNDPTALVDAGVLNKNELYLDEMIYETNLTNQDIMKYFKEFDLSKTQDEIFADESAPKDIKDIKNAGWNIRAAKKGPGSVDYGINLLKQYKIHITSRSTNFIKESRKYKWKVDKDSGKPTNKPIDMFNHCWDASRYYGVMKLSSLVSSIKMAGMQRGHR